MTFNGKAGIFLILAPLFLAIALSEPQRNPLMVKEGHAGKSENVKTFLYKHTKLFSINSIYITTV